MGTTPNKGIRYPEPEDMVIDGAAAMRLLAEDVDAALGGAYYFGLLAPAPQSVANNADATAAIGVDLSSAFSTWAEAGGTITYTGPDALAIITGYTQWAVNAVGYRRVAILQNGTGVGATRDTPDDAAATEQAVSQLVKLTSGDTLALRVRQTSGAALDLTNAKLRVVVVAGV